MRASNIQHNVASPVDDEAPASTPTVVGGLARALLEAVAAMGADVDGLLAATGLPKRRVQNFSSRMGADAHDELWTAAVKELGREDLGLIVGESHMRPASYGVVGFLAACGPTFADSLGAIADHYRLIAPHTCSFVVGERTGVIAIAGRPGQPPMPSAFADNIAATYVAASRSMTGEDVGPRSVHIQRNRPSDAGRKAFDSLFRAPVAFGAPAIMVEFEREVLELQVRGAETALRAILLKVAQRELEELREEDPVITELREVVLEVLRRARPRIGSAARVLGMSSRTLQRRLGGADLTFRDIVDQVTCHEAQRLLRDRSMSVRTVAKTLGYRDVRAFSRAFRRWTSRTPTAFRNG